MRIVRRVAVFALVLVLGLIGLAARSQQPPSVGAGAVAREGIGGRALGVGGAFSAIADDATAGYYNPAGLATLSGIRIGGMIERRFAPGSSFQYLCGSGRLEAIGLAAGASIIWRSDTGIPYEGGTFDAVDSMWLISAAYDLGGVAPLGRISMLAFGANLKLYAAAGLEERRSRGIGFDASALVGLSLDELTLRVSYMSSDIGGSTIQWEGTLQEIAEVIPWLHRFGAALLWDAMGIVISGDVDLVPGQSNLNRVRFGAAYRFRGFSFRGGLDGGTPTIGVGAEILDGFAFDAAIRFHPSDLGQSYVISSEFRF